MIAMDGWTRMERVIWSEGDEVGRRQKEAGLHSDIKILTRLGMQGLGMESLTIWRHESRIKDGIGESGSCRVVRPSTSLGLGHYGAVGCGGTERGNGWVQAEPQAENERREPIGTLSLLIPTISYSPTPSFNKTPTKCLTLSVSGRERVTCSRRGSRVSAMRLSCLGKLLLKVMPCRPWYAPHVHLLDHLQGR